MRGKAFHNLMVKKTQTLFGYHGWQVYTEYRCRRNGITTYFDLFAVKENRKIACEIETTVRHAMDNIVKALAMDICLWVIVPTHSICRQVKQKLASSNLNTSHKTVRILLFSQLETEDTSLI